jgi:hypothetical protein
MGKGWNENIPDQSIDNVPVPSKVESMLHEQMLVLFRDLHETDGDSFDITLDFVTNLLMYEEDTYKEFIEYTQLLQKAIKYKWKDVEESTRLIANPILVKKTLIQNKESLQWKYRRDCLRYLIHIYYKRQILSFRVPTYASIEGVDEIETSDGSSKRDTSGEEIQHNETDGKGIAITNPQQVTG